MDIAKKIRENLKIKGISQKEFASKINMSEVALSAALKRNDFKVSLLQRMADTLEVPIISFFVDDKVKNELGKLEQEFFEISKAVQMRDDLLKQANEIIDIEAKSREEIYKSSKALLEESHNIIRSQIKEKKHLHDSFLNLLFDIFTFQDKTLNETNLKAFFDTIFSNIYIDNIMDVEDYIKELQTVLPNYSRPKRTKIKKN